ncbi:hypothetical protein C8Q75DRAFT_746382 [Abortiporus biennis]|nr:hypothetical protein C8Q75DRAFT_746382 [Abortiporus biennis]
MSKVVFVGNVPYNMGEEQLIDAFKSVGQVVGFRLVFDRDTGKPKGYGFCEFADHDTALSAVRNLNGQEIGGRPLRIDLADSDPFLEGKTTVRGELIDQHETRAQWRERDPEHRSRPSASKTDFLANLPPGQPVPPGTTSMDMITEMLATADPVKILEVLAQMKAFVITHPEQAKALLVAHPQLGYALFQALLVNKIVDTQILQRMLNATTGATPSASAPPPAPPPVTNYQPPMQQPSYTAPPLSMPSGVPSGVPPSSMYPPPGAHNMPPMQQPGYYRPPPPPQAVPTTQPVPQVQSAPAATPPAAAPFPPAQRDMLLQVLRLTTEQINSLPPAERDQIHQLRQQFGVTS